jgi:hypothetical protein
MESEAAFELHATDSDDYDDPYYWVGQIRTATWTFRSGVLDHRVQRLVVALQARIVPTVIVQVGSADYTVIAFGKGGDILWGAPCFRTSLEARMVVRELEDLIEVVGCTIAGEAFDDMIMGEIVAELRGALVLYPRAAGEDLVHWSERVIGEHAAAPEYRLGHALGVARGASFSMQNEDLEAALGDLQSGGSGSSN